MIVDHEVVVVDRISAIVHESASLEIKRATKSSVVATKSTDVVDPRHRNALVCQLPLSSACQTGHCRMDASTSARKSPSVSTSTCSEGGRDGCHMEVLGM